MKSMDSASRVNGCVAQLMRYDDLLDYFRQITVDRDGPNALAFHVKPLDSALMLSHWLKQEDDAHGFTQLKRIGLIILLFEHMDRFTNIGVCHISTLL